MEIDRQQEKPAHNKRNRYATQLHTCAPAPSHARALSRKCARAHKQEARHTLCVEQRWRAAPWHKPVGRMYRSRVACAAGSSDSLLVQLISDKPAVSADLVKFCVQYNTFVSAPCPCGG